MDILLAIDHEAVENYIASLQGVTVVKTIHKKKELLNEYKALSAESVIIISHLLSGREKMLNVINQITSDYKGRIIYLYFGEDNEIKKSWINYLIEKGIYDFSTGDLNQEDIKRLIFCPKTRKDVEKYISAATKIEEKLKEQEKINKLEDQGKEVVVVEKIVSTPVQSGPRQIEIKGEIQIGVAGTMHRIGVTHCAINIAQYLVNLKKKVAVVECNNNHTFKYVKDKDYFNLSGIDFYSDYSNKLHMVITKDYDFIILDLGVYSECNLTEFNRSNIQIVLSGTKPWEAEKLEDVFKNANEEVLKNYNYLFNFTSKSEINRLKKNMNPLKKVFILEYTPSPFKNIDKNYEVLLKEYVDSITKERTKKSLFGIFN